MGTAIDASTVWVILLVKGFPVSDWDFLGIEKNYDDSNAGSLVGLTLCKRKFLSPKVFQDN